MRKFVIAGMAALGILPVSARDIRVPSEYETIQQAVDNAVTGDTVIVNPGVYRGPGNTDILVAGKAVTIRSESGFCATTLDGENQSHAFIYRSESRENLLEGFTIRNCGGCISAGIAIEDGANVTVRNCLILSCHAASGGAEGGAIRVLRSEARIENTRIQNCSALQGGGINVVDHAVVTLQECTLIGCDGSAVFVNLDSRVTASDCTFADNLASNISYAAGVGCFKNSTLNLDRCHFRSNRNHYSDGGAIRVDRSSVRIVNTLFNGNISAVSAGAVLFREQSSGEILFATFAGNDSNQGSAISIENSNPVFKACIAWNELAEMEIRAGTGAAHGVAYSDIRGGHVGIGNINKDPCFTCDGTYHLTGDSPCIDTGLQIGVLTDIDGDVRPNGRNADMGADEYYTPPDLFADLRMPSELYLPGDPFYLELHLDNRAEPLEGIPVFCILDALGSFFFWPGWNAFDYEIRDIPGSAVTPIEILPLFLWPEGAGSAAGIRFYGACTDPEITGILGGMDMETFGWAE